MQAWQQELARKLGAAVDATHDLARVLRVPGFLNHKDPNDVVPVEVMWMAGPRSTPADWRNVGATPPATHKTLERFDAKNTLVLSEDAQPDLAKLDLLIEAIPEVRKLLDHTRKIADASLSGYDMGLADYAAQANWNDQEIAELLIYHRRKWHGDELQLQRADKYAMTIAKARIGSGDPVSVEQIGDALGIPILRILRVKDDDSSGQPSYRVETRNGLRIDLGKAREPALTESHAGADDRRGVLCGTGQGWALGADCSRHP